MRACQVSSRVLSHMIPNRRRAPVPGDTLGSVPATSANEDDEIHDEELPGVSRSVFISATLRRMSEIWVSMSRMRSPHCVSKFHRFKSVKYKPSTITRIDTPMPTFLIQSHSSLGGNANSSSANSP